MAPDGSRSQFEEEPEPPVAPLWRSRMRWRMRGAWMWPVWMIATAFDGLLLNRLPFTGAGADIIPALIAAGFINLVLVAVAAPLAGLALRRRRADLPRAIATDYAGAVILLGAGAALLAGGILHRPGAERCLRDFRAQSETARRYVLAQASAQYRRNIAQATTLKLESHLYRTCVPGNDPDRSLCLTINTDQHPPGVRRELSQETNAQFAGPVNAYKARCG